MSSSQVNVGHSAGCWRQNDIYQYVNNLDDSTYCTIATVWMLGVNIEV